MSLPAIFWPRLRSKRATMSERRVRIGCGAGFWGDSPEGAIQLVERGNLDYLVVDYLSEVTMSVLARAKEKDPSAGYARDFIRPVMESILPDIASRGIKVIANAGGMNLPACRDALATLAAEQHVDMRIATVTGDDLSPDVETLRMDGVREMETGAPLPDGLRSVNAYLGAGPIRAALDRDADIVLTGRCVDSALVLGPLMHEFGWSENDYDRLAAGSLAGHIVECGVQGVGGNFTDWQDVEGWDEMGFPILDCGEDGRFIVTKPPETGGLVSPLSVGEQVLYELGDPASYILPDVICDFTDVALDPLNGESVLVSGAKGRPPPDMYKVSATYLDGYRATAFFTMVGRDNYRKVERVGEAILARTRRLFAAQGLKDYRRTSLKILGSEDIYGEAARKEARASRELVLRLDVHHDDRKAVEIFAHEIAPAGTAMGPGRC
ncbi:MAG: DUF1446 domain-containing protein, partial [Alphaproteobacteria bacterium]|nr:DUF1446 domain-containing protein [Alphaproteobacteria bacterium]